MGLIRIPVADVRSASGTLPSSLDYDPLEETQLLYNEPVEILAESGDWVKIRALEQMEFSHSNAWEGYPGWVLKGAVLPVRNLKEPKFVVKKRIGRLFAKPDPESAYTELSMGTKLAATDEQQNGFWKVKTAEGKTAWVPKNDVRLLAVLPDEYARRLILESASELLGDPYFWGGRSAHMMDLKNQVTAVDCSGLVNLAYRVAGIDIPRDSFEQHLKAVKIKKSELQMGDLIFSASKDQPEKISHVAIFVDSNYVIEAPQTGEIVRKITFEQKYGAPFDRIWDETPVADRVLYFGTYFSK